MGLRWFRDFFLSSIIEDISDVLCTLVSEAISVNESTAKIPIIIPTINVMLLFIIKC